MAAGDSANRHFVDAGADGFATGAAGAAGYYWLELGWHRLRQFKARLLGQTEKAADFAVHCGQVNDAWRDTDHGRQSPPRPW